MISDIFEKPNFNEWASVAAKSIGLSKEELESFITSYSFDDMELKAQIQNPKEEIYLNTFPTNRILARHITKGQASDYQEEGIDYIFTASPVTLNRDQKLIQILKESHNTIFGDETLVDVFSLLQEFKYDGEKIYKFLEKISKKDNVHLLIDGSIMHNSGLSLCREVSVMLHLALKFMHPFIENNKKIVFMTSLDSQYFSQIAKLRGLRYLIETIFEQLNITTENLLIIAKSSLRELTLYDPWTNMLRITSHISSGIIGGADVITPSCFDGLNQIFAIKESSELALRQSRNSFHVLMEESVLSRVNDPARGSEIIEDLTHQVVQTSFTFLKELNQHKSLLFMFEKLSELALEKNTERKLATQMRSKTICGVNNFTNGKERIKDLFSIKLLKNFKHANELFPLRRDAEEFEWLRLRVEQSKLIERKILVLSYGDQRKLNARISFCRNYFEILGLESEVFKVEDKMTIDYNDYIGIVYCAQDDDYADLFNLSEMTTSLTSFIAGKKFQKPGLINLYQGQNIYNVLNQFCEKLEIK